MNTASHSAAMRVSGRAVDATDPLGVNMRDHYHGFECEPPDLRLQAIVKQNPTVLERDDGYLAVSGGEMAFYFAPYEQWPEAERRIVANCGARP